MGDRKSFTPRPYQTLAMDFIASHPRCALWAGMGMGKTSTCLNLMDTYYNVMGQTEPTLVLAPKRVAQSTWPDEARKWQGLESLEVVPIVGDLHQRVAALRKDVPIHTLNYENLPWLLAYLGNRWPYRRVIADESTRLKSFRTKQGSVRAQALGKVAHTKVREFIELTGTPSPNGLKDLWGQAWFLDEGQRLGRTYSAFEERWFAYKRIKDAISGRMDIVPEIMPYASEQIHSRLKDLCLTLDPKDWFDLKDPIVNTVYVELPDKARRVYREMEREMFTRLGGHDIEAFSAAGKTLKCLQIANGAAYVDPAVLGDTESKALMWEEIHDEKLQALESIIEEAAGMPVLVAYHFKSDLARLQRAFPKGRALDADPQTILDWNLGRIPVLFAHPQSAGHGLSLQDGGNIIVFFAHWWDLELHDQIVERIGPVRQAQSGHDRAVFIHYIVARDTVDEVVMLRRDGKRSVQDLLLDYMKRKKL